MNRRQYQQRWIRALTIFERKLLGRAARARAVYRVANFVLWYPDALTRPVLCCWAISRVTCARLIPVMRTKYRRTNPFPGLSRLPYSCCTRVLSTHSYTSLRP